MLAVLIFCYLLGSVKSFVVHPSLIRRSLRNSGRNDDRRTINNFHFRHQITRRLAYISDDDGGVLNDIRSKKYSKLSREQRRTMVEEYRVKMGGTRTISRVLVACNGMAGMKMMLSIRKWSYATFGNEHAIELVAMVTKDDLAANAEYIRHADAIVQVPSKKTSDVTSPILHSIIPSLNLNQVPPGPNKVNYANVDVIVPT